ncbi:3-deoxy-7-phosphoheptulonate synthase [Catellicoccus marimammalium]|uniref:2-keto-3-deoxy-D-arabino-heptulosonate-7-phosphate synthase I beta n=1 Tax=Catellicoccus marimammalium M35/04/3 TaxID=1234409 RepID=K8ZNU4_9ENTE|nr:3-deoxy-7-phosphoheptulonate synthase [Catellicoccus marimammalium]EKU27266.1 2-keto-3-deoxy-D-arabino-heptulosonate-7- phosphate synthase I beta [Catellicoccus marimammalium M35/04/3]
MENKRNHPYYLGSREYQKEDTIIDLGDCKIGGGHFVKMAGPCSVESEEQILQTAKAVKEAGGQVLRGGAFKPRTNPYSFQGLGLEGLQLLRKAADQYGLKVVTEVMDEGHIAMVREYTDIFQIGARNMQNYRLLEAIGKEDKPVLLKRGLSATIDEWLSAAEYIANEGNRQIILVERGIRTFETKTRNTFDVSAVPVIHRLSHYPILVDPSHAAGKKEYVEPLTLAGVAAGADGFIIEIHPHPEEALSDGEQSLSLKQWASLSQKVDALLPVVQSIYDRKDS